MAITTSPQMTPPSPAPLRGAGAGWIDLDTAAARSGKSIGHLRRLSGDQWLAEGLAELRRPAGGGNLAWFVREDAATSFGRVKSAEQLSHEFDIRTLTAGQREELQRRERIARGWKDARGNALALGMTTEQAMEQYLSRLDSLGGEKISARTVYYWWAAYSRLGLAGLIDGRWRTATTAPEAVDPFLDEVKHLYLDQRCRSKRLCYDRACDLARERGWTVIAYRTVCRALAKIPRKAVALRRQGDRKFDGRHGAYHERDYSGLRSNDVWESDHHEFDVWIEHAGERVRPWLTAWMDVRSRYVVGWHIGVKAGDSWTILKSFRAAGEANGFPRHVHLDNGKDYDAYALQGQTKKQRLARARARKHTDVVAEIAGVFPRLGVDVIHARAFNAKAKTIERQFRTLRERFSQQWETYCGNCPQTRPQDLQDQLARAKAPTLEEFTAAFADWIDIDFHRRPHEGLEGRKPADVYAAELESKRVLPANLLDVEILRELPPQKIGRNGVRYEGLSYGRSEPELWKREGQKVILRVNDEDLKQVQIYDLAGKLICVAPANEKLPYLATREQLKAAMSQQRADKRKLREYIQTRPRLSDSLADRMHRKAAAVVAQKPSPDTQPPPSISPIRTSLEPEAPAVQAAFERAGLRAAVGAESAPLPSRFIYQTNLRDDRDEEPASSPFVYQSSTEEES